MGISTRKRLLALTMGATLVGHGVLHAADCNGNGVDDASDVLPPSSSFLSGPSYSVGNGPVSLVAEDFNGDGVRDLAALNIGGRSLLEPSDISILLNRGDGTLHPAVSYPGGVGRNDPSLITADFNGDGVPDLATANDGCTDCIPPISGTVSVFLSRGDGTVHAAVPYAVPGHPRFPIASDLNGDGWPDLATANSIEDSMSILLNQGDGTFHPAVSYPGEVGWVPPVAADYNGDGFLDLATARAGCPVCMPPAAHTVSVFLNRGDGTFHSAVPYTAANTPISLVTADLDVDGFPDLATANYYGCFDCIPAIPDIVSVLLNEGDGTFHSPENYDVGIFPRFLVVADLNSDGFPDIATANRGCPIRRGFGCSPIVHSDVSVLLNRGDGTLHAATSYRTGDWPASLIAADINGDGALDLVTAGGDVDEDIRPVISILINRRDGIFRSAVTYSLRSTPLLNSVLATDLDGDGKPELAAAKYYEDVISVFLYVTTPPFSLDVNENDVPDECDPGAFHRGDANVDGTTGLADAIMIFRYLFLTDPPDPSCKESADVNNDTVIDISDGIRLLNWLFLGGPEPASPGSASAPCGLDPDPIDSPGNLGCLSYDHCP